MYARIISTKVKPDKMDELIEQYSQAMENASDEARQGHRTTYFLVDRETNQTMVVALWDSLEGAEAAAQSQWNQELAQKLRPLFEGTPERVVYEVAVVAHSQS